MRTQFSHSLRILLKYRLYTGFALIGLSMAVASVWFITSYVRTSYNYDTFHTDHDRIYRLSMEVTAGGNTDHFATTGKPLGEFLKKNYPEIEAYARLQFHPSLVRQKEEVFQESGFFRTNPQTLSVFTFNFLRGNQDALSEPNSVVLVRSLAEKYFNDIDVLGKTLLVNGKTHRITGVFQDWPENTHIDIKALFPLDENAEYDAQSWFDIEQYTYVLINQNSQPEDLNNSLDHVASQQLAPMIAGSGLNVQFYAQALREVYFSPGLVDDVKKGSIVYTNILAIAGLLILVIAGLNFVNLTLTMSTRRSKEILLKKILGISPRQLFLQSTMESGAITLLVLLLAAGLVILGEKFYVDYTGYASMRSFENWSFVLITPLLIMGLGMLGSSYTGVILTFSSKPIDREKLRINLFKKILLGFQYSLATFVLIMTLSMGRQLDFIQNKDLGFDQKEVLIVDLLENENFADKGLQLREYLHTHASIENASLIGWGALPGEENGKEIFEVSEEGKKTEKIYNIYRVDEHYFDLLEIQFAQGRNFDSDIESDKTRSVIINESLANSLNWNKPLGKKISYGGEMREVIGVIKNFHNKSLHNVIEPIVFVFETEQANNLLIRAQTSDMATIKTAWKSFYPEAPFTLTYFDQFIGAMYEKEAQLTQLFRFFSIVSLILCSMGLFALFSLHVLQKTKEMSIRKLLGANYLHLLRAIIKDYSTVFILSIGVAIPLAWFMVKRWLAEFHFNVQIGADLYFLAGFIMLSASLTVLAYHLIKVVHINLADTLKNE